MIESATAMSPESLTDLLNAHVVLPRKKRLDAGLLCSSAAVHLVQRRSTCRLAIPTLVQSKLSADGEELVLTKLKVPTPTADVRYEA